MRKFHNRSLADCKFHAMSDTWPQRDKQGKGLKKKQPMKSTLSSKTQVPTLSIPPKLSRIFFFPLLLKNSKKRDARHLNVLRDPPSLL